MKELLNSKIIYSILIIFVAVRVINTEEDYSDTINTSSSLDSKSKEIFNCSSKEKPRIERRGDTQDSLSVDQSVSDCTDKNTKSNSTDIEIVTQIRKMNDANDKKYTSKFSFSVTIQKRGSHYATGALIDKKWILSVAELFFNVRESIKLYKARLGSLNCKQGGTLLGLKGIEFHPFYTYKQPNYDVALLRIAGSGADDTASIHPISLTKFHGDVVKAKFWTTYWPRLIVQGDILSSSAKERVKQNTMRLSSQVMIPRQKCEKVLEVLNVTLDDSSLCMEPLTFHHSRCLPDPGAPIVADNYLWGITSGWTSAECTLRTSPTLVTTVSAPPVREWIHTIVKKL